MAISIRTEELGVKYGETRVWKGINLNIDQPGLVSIIGPNGVGKSTFMYCINKILEPTEGRIFLNDVDVQKMDFCDIAKLIAYVPQMSNETFSMPVMDTVLMGRYPHTGYNTSEEDLQIAARCLEMMNISDLAMRNFDELSAGQHQKVMIARGLAQEPQLLMLDEPTSNLDIYHQIYVMKLLRDIAVEKGITVLVICHDLNIAARFSDRIILFSQGNVYVDGSAEEVITAANIQEVYNVRADVMTVDGRPYVIFHADESLSFGTSPSETSEAPALCTEPLPKQTTA
ncbi:ABC transporter ATP-binding protein [Candidatus Methanomassiliicoccus intestinalis]|uniref:ABC transporter ATP-binding protein n=1 Tax=Candidatus Methanomassiliicoccus intestinalis TaxID=1406512 RepID=UPI0037DDB2BC